MYNIFPYVFDSKEDFETVCKDFDERDRNLTECADYFNKHIVTIRDAILNKRHFMKKYKIEYIEPCN